MNDAETSVLTKTEIGIVVAAHAPVGRAFANAARGITNFEDVLVVDIDRDAQAAAAFESMRQAVESAESGRGVLVLADLFGGTAANIALAQLDHPGVEVITGLNLPMLLAAIEQRGESTSVRDLAARCADVARQSVVVAAELLDGPKLVASPSRPLVA